MNERDIHLFLGTTQKFHAVRGNDPFVIIGVFYPKHLEQLDLFEWALAANLAACPT